MLQQKTILRNLTNTKTYSAFLSVSLFFLSLHLYAQGPKVKLIVKGNAITEDTVKAAFYLKGGQPFLGTQWTTAGSNIFYNTGNIGIATGSPSEKLSVNGNAIVSGSIFAGYLKGIDNSPATFDSIKVTGLSGTGQRLLAVSGSGNIVTANVNSFGWQLSGNSSTSAATNFLGTTDTADMVFKTNSQERIRITSTGDHPGNVGIGTNDPHKKLHVLTTHTLCVNCPQSHEGIRLEDQIYDSQLNTTDINAWDLQPFASLNFAIKRPNETPKLVITSGGFVGIGTTAPGKTLEVNGTGKFTGDVSLMGNTGI